MARISEILSNIEMGFLNAIVRKENEEKPIAPKNKRPRVHEIAKEYGTDAKTAIGVLKELEEFVKGPSSTLQFPVARKLRIALEERGYQRVSSDELAPPSLPLLDSPSPRPKPKSTIDSNPKPAGLAKSKPRGMSPKEQLLAKRYVFDRRRLDLLLSEFNRNPTNNNRALVVSEYHKLHKTVFKRVSDVVERKNLLNRIQAEYLDFNSEKHEKSGTGESLFPRKIPSLGEKAIKPFRGLTNRTPDGPKSDSYWDNPVQDR